MAALARLISSVSLLRSRIPAPLFVLPEHHLLLLFRFGSCRRNPQSMHADEAMLLFIPFGNFFRFCP